MCVKTITIWRMVLFFVGVLSNGVVYVLEPRSAVIGIIRIPRATVSSAYQSDGRSLQRQTLSVINIATWRTNSQQVG